MSLIGWLGFGHLKHAVDMVLQIPVLSVNVNNINTTRAPLGSLVCCEDLKLLMSHDEIAVFFPSLPPF